MVELNRGPPHQRPPGETFKICCLSAYTEASSALQGAQDN
jgi:hypothetical protein